MGAQFYYGYAESIEIEQYFHVVGIKDDDAKGKIKKDKFSATTMVAMGNHEMGMENLKSQRKKRAR
ncbi:hypothetical protein J1N35_014582 [Gossypium stocksii]|uniref:Uncharacterized protein n=1 Tax=Gossypium stocksii TaxID=47602 RepID=A0A9D3VWD0_9ROSI|nr:hypothetical protein J1N35_014582 [Gossypium stocksii]